MAEVGIERVVIKIGKKEVELSLAEAQELKDILNETFGRVEVRIERPMTIPYPVPVWPYPKFTYQTPSWHIEYRSNAMMLRSGSNSE